MPARTVTDLTQATLKFAAGNDQTREQVSSTWYVRMTRGAEVYVFNKGTGGNMAHISFHKDGTCHFRVEDRGRGKRTVTDWELPPPVDQEGLLRLATVAIPHRGLVPPAGLTEPEPETVLIPPPPPPGHQIEVDIFVEPGAVPTNAWPGQSTLAARLVGRFTLYNTSPEQGLLNFSLVWRPCAQKV